MREPFVMNIVSESFSKGLAQGRRELADALEARDKTIAELVAILRMVSDLSAFNHEYESYMVPLNAIVAVDVAISQAKSKDKSE